MVEETEQDNIGGFNIMPVMEIKKKGRTIGFRWGKGGKTYLIGKYGKKRSRNLALRQGRAIKASQSRILRLRKDGVRQRYWVKNR